MKKKFITVHELQNNTSGLIREVEKGGKFTVLRYSQPIGVLMGVKEYEQLSGLTLEQVNECKKCLNEFKTILREKKS